MKKRSVIVLCGLSILIMSCENQLEKRIKGMEEAEKMKYDMELVMYNTAGGGSLKETLVNNVSDKQFIDSMTKKIDDSFPAPEFKPTSRAEKEARIKELDSQNDLTKEVLARVDSAVNAEKERIRQAEYDYLFIVIMNKSVSEK